MVAIHRRKLGLCAAAAALGGGLGTAAAQGVFQRSNPGPETAAGDPDLKGICDIHIHAAPDSKPRRVTELAVDARRAGYRAVLFKSNDFSSHDRAFHLRRFVEGIEIFGSLVLNRTTGDRVNPYAVEKAIATTGGLCRAVWLPTLDAEYAVRTYRENRPGIPVTDGARKVLPEVIRVMTLCAQADIILATGHCSPEESLLLARTARDIGLKKFVVTHPNSLIWRMTPQQIEAAASCGAWIECCYLGRLWGPGTGLPQFERETSEEFNAFMQVAPERTFISTDLGQVGLPHPVDGMKAAVNEMRKLGFATSRIEDHVRKIPGRLLGLDA